MGAVRLPRVFASAQALRPLIVERGTIRAWRVRISVPYSGPAQEAALRSLHRRDLQGRVPAPGVHVANVQQCLDAARTGDSAGLYNLVNLFSGGALLQLTIFALGIMPYITASIILQLLVVVIPRLERLKKEGQAGQTKITQYTRYLTLGLAVLQATGIVALARSATCSRAAPSHCCTTTAPPPSWSWSSP